MLSQWYGEHILSITKTILRLLFRPLHKWCLWHEETVLAHLQWFRCVPYTGVHHSKRPRQEWIHILLHAQVRLCSNTHYFIKESHIFHLQSNSCVQTPSVISRKTLLFIVDKTYKLVFWSFPHLKFLTKYASPLIPGRRSQLYRTLCLRAWKKPDCKRFLAVLYNTFTIKRRNPEWESVSYKRQCRFCSIVSRSLYWGVKPHTDHRVSSPCWTH